jgi:hypothetical protein
MSESPANVHNKHQRNEVVVELRKGILPNHSRNPCQNGHHQDPLDDCHGDVVRVLVVKREKVSWRHDDHEQEKHRLDGSEGVWVGLQVVEAHVEEHEGPEAGNGKEGRVHACIVGCSEEQLEFVRVHGLVCLVWMSRSFRKEHGS